MSACRSHGMVQRLGLVCDHPGCDRRFWPAQRPDGRVGEAGERGALAQIRRQCKGRGWRVLGRAMTRDLCPAHAGLWAGAE